MLVYISARQYRGVSMSQCIFGCEPPLTEFIVLLAQTRDLQMAHVQTHTDHRSMNI